MGAIIVDVLDLLGTQSGARILVYPQETLGIDCLRAQALGYHPLRKRKPILTKEGIVESEVTLQSTSIETYDAHVGRPCPLGEKEDDSSLDVSASLSEELIVE